MSTDPRELLARHFGYPAFRPGQEELVRAALAGRDALGVLPTGGGKSVCYQIPALALGGLTLVVTPLVSLMEDQVGRASSGGLRAAYLSAGQESTERRRILEQARSGALDILFVAPERLGLPGFIDALGSVTIRLIAVDEAHCISEWGHDFRPCYRRIGAVRGRFEAPVLALTATATPHVRADVVGSLRLRDPLVVVRSFDRPNLAWAVLPGTSHAQRARRVGRLLRRIPGAAVVYAPTRRTVEDVRDVLASFGIVAEAYHAGLAADERSRVQAAFMSGTARVVVATNAFGMGIDKADVRLVAHVQLPGTLEAYYQEAGRAGRDGAPAWCIAFDGSSDQALGKSFVDAGHPPGRSLVRLHGVLRARADGMGVAWLDPGEMETGLAGAVGRPHLEAMLAALERVGGVRVLQDGRGGREGTRRSPEGSQGLRIGVASTLRLRSARRSRRAALGKLRSVRRYAEGRRCRRGTLLRYFGEDAPRRCDACDRCLARFSSKRINSHKAPWIDI